MQEEDDGKMAIDTSTHSFLIKSTGQTEDLLI